MAGNKTVGAFAYVFLAAMSPFAMTLFAAQSFAKPVAAVASPQGTPTVYVKVKPPALVVEKRPVSPGPNYAWVPGYQAWNGSAYVWTPGSWQVPPGPRRTWVPGRWAHSLHGYYWIDGHWR
jgi:hypothetical protein